MQSLHFSGNTQEQERPDQPSAATGTVMRTDTLQRYARDAGFRDVEVLPIDNFFLRFYRLKQ